MVDSILSGDSRREKTFKMLFAREYDLKNEPDNTYSSFFDEDEGAPTDGYVHDTFFGAVSYTPEADKLIEADSKKWKMTRMSVAVRTVLRLAVYEIMNTETPPKVAINEALELTKKYGEDSSPSFVNGILNRIAKDNGKI